VGGCDVELNISGGGEGPDCVFYFSFTVLSLKVKGSVAISLFARILDVKCIPTAYDQFSFWALPVFKGKKKRSKHCFARSCCVPSTNDQ
jgi:hypothetical protein